MSEHPPHSREVVQVAPQTYEIRIPGEDWPVATTEQYVDKRTGTPLNDPKADAELIAVANEMLTELRSLYRTLAELVGTNPSLRGDIERVRALLEKTSTNRRRA